MTTPTPTRSLANARSQLLRAAVNGSALAARACYIADVARKGTPSKAVRDAYDAAHSTTNLAEAS